MACFHSKVEIVESSGFLSSFPLTKWFMHLLMIFADFDENSDHSASVVTSLKAM